MNVVVSGAGCGLGEKLCLHLAGAGHRVFALARNGDRLATMAARRRGRIIPVSADITRPDQIREAFDSIECMHGAIEGLVNACAAGSTNDLWSADPAAMEAARDAGLRGAVHCTRAIIPHLLKYRGGRIVTIAPAPAAGLTGQTGVTAYADDSCRDLRPQGIVASTLCPGRRTLAARSDSASAEVQPQATPDTCFAELVELLEFLLTRPATLVWQRLEVVQQAVWQ